MAGRQNVAVQRAERFRFVVRSQVPARGFGLAMDDIYKWLRDRFGQNGYETLPANYRGKHSIAIYLDDAVAIPELVALLDRVEAAQGGPGEWPA